MDFYFISPYKIILNIGLIGFGFTIIGLIISSFSKCQGREIIIKNFCIKEENNTVYYYDSIFIYLNELNSSLFKEIILTLFYLIICFSEFTCEIMTINYLNPIYTLINDNIYYFFMKIINFFYLYYFTLTQFIIMELAEILAILGYSVYLEIIELKFFGLDKDIRKNIIKRGNKEILHIINTPDDYYDDSSQEND